MNSNYSIGGGGGLPVKATHDQNIFNLGESH